MKRFSTVLRLTLWLVATFAIVFLAQAQRGNKRVAASHQIMRYGHSIQIFDQNGQPAVSGVPSATSTIVDVTVAPGGSFTFDPATVNISVGDTVRWTWAASGHSVTSGDSSSCVSDGEFCSPDNTNCSTCVLSNVGFVYEFTFTQAGNFSYFCCAHCFIGMVGAVNVSAASPTPTATATATATAIATATGTPSSCSWGNGPDLPMTDTRSVGVFFPANGKFYVMGGRDLNNVEVTNPFEYNPGSNSWTTKSAAYPDAFTNNMACGVLNDSGTDYIYCAGGSNFATQTTSGRVFRYDPIADVITTVSSNYPPGDAGILPGGFTVFNNTLITVGGFDIPNGVGTNQIWQFTPSPAGWVQKSAVLPVPLGYLPTTTIGSLVYTGGGADITGGVLTDTQNAFVYYPVADSINAIANVPDATSNTRAVNFCNLMYVLGGNFNAPTNEVQIYDPVSNTWSVGIPFPTAGRNFAADTDGTNNIWKAGGYASDGATVIATTEIFNCPVSPCGSPSPTPTATATATPTATAAPRSTPSPRPRPTPHGRP